MTEDRPAGIERLDARGLRGLAHPLRVRILSLLRLDGPATATGLAKRLGETSGTTSWHLRQLAEHGFVEEDTERGNRRERWWRAVHRSTSLDTAQFAEEPDLRGPLSVYLHEALNQSFQRAATYLSETWDREWHEAASLSAVTARLGPQRLRELSDEMSALVERYREMDQKDDVAVMVQWQAFPVRRQVES